MTVNKALRRHTTSQAFVLTMRKTHILALVSAHYAISNPGARIPHFPQFITGIRGCRERGLADHHPPPGLVSDRPFSDFSSITTAGYLMRALLIEAGLWQEAEEELMISGSSPTAEASDLKSDQ